MREPQQFWLLFYQVNNSSLSLCVQRCSMAPIQCFKYSGIVPGRFSARKLLKLVQVVKPVLRLMKKKQRTNTVTPSSCNYDVESVQNDINESELFQLDFKFFDETIDEADDNLRNEELEKRLLKLQPDAEKKWAKSWAPDSDICKRGDEFFTGEQRAEQQVP